MSAGVRWELESELALRAVSTAGEIIVDRSERIVTSTRGSLRDVTTELDLRLEKHISSVLAPSGHPIIGEESFASGEGLLPPGGRPLWLVDPIDGTANWVTGMPFYGVSAGLRSGEAFVAGAVSLPALKELYFTFGDRGAYLNGKALKSGDSPLEAALIAVSFAGASADPVRRKAQYGVFGELNDRSRGCLRLGSAAANICFVASGRLQAALGFEAPLWDVAGALAVAAQAGSAIRVWRKAGGYRVDYVVGAARAVDSILAILAGESLFEGEADR